MRASLKALSHPYPAASLELDQIERSASRSERLPIMTTFLLPIYKYHLWSDYQSRALAGAAQIATAAKAYKFTHGTYPASLEELTKAGWRLPADPFTGQPYHYRRESQGLAVWSVGPDLIDNGGLDYATAKIARDKPGYDFVFRCSDVLAPSDSTSRSRLQQRSRR